MRLRSQWQNQSEGGHGFLQGDENGMPEVGVGLFPARVGPTFRGGDVRPALQQNTGERAGNGGHVPVEGRRGGAEPG